MTQTHPITPPPELVGQWLCSEDYQWGPLEQASITITTNRLQNVATQAAQWGADQELEACAEWVNTWCTPRYLRDPSKWGGDAISADVLRAARRRKPPSLKAQALAVLDHTQKGYGLAEVDLDTIRRALEAL